MSFVYPSFLWAFAVLIIPVVIHLFNFRRYKTLYFSSIQFIKKVDRETNATKTLRHYLLLLMRLLAFSALVLAFAQPYIPQSTGVSKGEKIIAFHVDNSFSMGAKGTNGDLLNQAKATVRSIAEQQPRDQKYMLTTNALSGREHRLITLTELEDRLDEIALTPQIRSLTNPLHSVQEQLQTDQFNGAVQHVVLSDFQTINLQRAEDDDVQIDSLAQYNLLQLAPQNQNNLFIDSVWFDSPFQRLNENTTLNVRVNNGSDAAVTNAEVNLTVGSTKRQALVDVPANGHTNSSINFTTKTIGTHKASVEVMDQQLYFDNKFYFTFHVNESVEVLLINGEDASDHPARVFATDDFYEVNERSAQQLQLDELAQADFVVLNGLNELSSGLVTQIKQRTERGQLVAIIPGTTIEQRSYNQLLTNLELPAIQDAVEQSLRIQSIYSDQSFFDGMFTKSVDHIRMPPLKKYYASRSFTGSNYFSLIEMENKQPLLVQSGSGNTFMYYTAGHASFNDFSKSALFAASLLRMGELSQSTHDLWLTIGENNSAQFRVDPPQDEVISLQRDPYSFIPSSSYSDGYLTINADFTQDQEKIEAGNYAIQTKNKELGQLALNYSRKESPLTYADASEINSLLKEKGAEQIRYDKVVNFSDSEQLSVQDDIEYWRILVILAILFLVAEMLIVILWKA
ncbi:MAG: vWA domain-containing protein [Bacteroidota bacterium]